MKFFSKVLAAVTFIIIVSLSVNAQNCGNCTGNNGNGNGNNGTNYGFSFISAPQLMEGTDLQVGAKYRFSDVAQATSAVITIVSATGGASVVILDDNNLTKPEAFSPRINIPANSVGMIEFKIQFFSGNGNSPKVIDTLRATAMDIDGNAEMHEMDALNMGAGSTLSYYAETLQISVVQTGNEFLATNIGGIEYDAVDTSAKAVMFTLMNRNKSEFIYKAGANNLATGGIDRQKGIYFKGFNYAASPLPVKFSAFTATAKEKTTLLSWTTDQEINNNRFDIERSFDGASFTKIGTIKAGTNGNIQQTYNFTDADVQNASIAYYRIKQIDIDGKSGFTNILVVKFKNSNNVTMQVSPNPFVSSVIARFESTEKATGILSIKNLVGQTVINKTILVNKGFNNTQIDGLANLPSGTYIATLVVNGNIIANQKIIK